MSSTSIAMTSGAALAAPVGEGVPRFRRALPVALLALLSSLVWTAPGWPQVPDNRGVRLDPEDAVSPAYEDTLDERDRQRMERAHERGDSFMPTFQGEGRARVETAPAAARRDHAATAGVAPVREAQAVSERPVPAYETMERPDASGGDGNDGLAAMVGVLLEAWTQPPTIARLRYGGADAGPPANAAETADTAPSRPDSGGRAGRLPPVRAGDGFYARTLYGVDSDYPGPVVLELLQPPLAGAVAHGGFERAGTRLVLRLSSLTWQGGTFPVDAWGVDPNCACYGIEGEVDRHFLSRVVLPAAARFAEGFLNAAAMPARTLTMQDGTVLHERGESGTEEALYAGAGAAVRTLGDILMADAPKETTVRIPRGTPLVVMFAAAPGESR